MTAYRLAAVAVAGVAWGFAPAGAEDAPKWGAHVDLEGKLGTDRHLGEVDLFVPLAQDGRTLLFTDIRTRMDDSDSREGNVGLGLRHMLDSGWNLGGYGYFDRRRSEYHNYFNQVTLGAEALSLDWDVRGNVYAPIGRTSREVDSLNTAEISGTSVIFRGGEERALGGFDAEIGWRVPLFAPEAGQQLRLYAGGYRFADDDAPTVAGPRGRAEMVFDEVPGLWDGARLSLGAEWQRDDPRGSQGFLSARLRIPLQAEASASRLTPMERRMTDPIVRDVDVVAQAGTFGPAETAVAGNGGVLRVVNSAATTTTAALQNELNTAGVGSTVILSGTFNTNAQVNMSNDQALMAGTVAVRSPSGRVATLNTSATIAAATNATDYVLNMADGAMVSGLTVTNFKTDGTAAWGITAQGRSDVVIRGNTVSVTSDAGGAVAIDARTTTNANVIGNTINAISAAVVANGIYLQSADNITVAGNSFNSVGVSRNAISGNQWTSFSAASIGNVAVSGGCTFGGATPPPANISFTNISCP